MNWNVMMHAVQQNDRPWSSWIENAVQILNKQTALHIFKLEISQFTSN